MSKVHKMILIKGLSPELDLGVTWDNDDSNSVMLCSAIDNNIVLLGNMPLTVANLSKIKNFNWKFLTKTFDTEWTPSEINWGEIPRYIDNSDELIKINVGGVEEDDGIIF